MSQNIDRLPKYNCAGLAERLNRSRCYVSAMKKAGYKFTHGSVTTEISAWAWLRENPTFVVTSVYPKKDPKQPSMALVPVA